MSVYSRYAVGNQPQLKEAVAKLATLHASDEAELLKAAAGK